MQGIKLALWLLAVAVGLVISAGIVGAAPGAPGVPAAPGASVFRLAFGTSQQPSPTPTGVITPTVTVTPTTTITATATPTPSSTPTPTATLSPTVPATDTVPFELLIGVESPRWDGIAARFAVSETLVQSAREAGLGWGEVFQAFRLAELAAASGVTTSATVSDIIALKQGGEGWGQIAKQLDIKPGLAGDNLGQALGAGRAPLPSPSPLATVQPTGGELSTTTLRGKKAATPTPTPVPGEDRERNKGRPADVGGGKRR